MKTSIGIATIFAAVVALPTAASEDNAPAQGMGGDMAPGMQQPLSTGLILPPMDAAQGRLLFASKGCVVCHSINGVGGQDAPMLDAEFMDLPMNPFEFAARMWRGAGAMVALQQDELGGQIELDGPGARRDHRLRPRRRRAGALHAGRHPRADRRDDARNGGSGRRGRPRRRRGRQLAAGGGGARTVVLRHRFGARAGRAGAGMRQARSLP